MANPRNTAYQVIYNVGLLDDIHNYFPALLYDNGRFQNMTQVFHYVRSEMNTRFNLFAYGASQYRESQAQHTEPEQNEQANPNIVRPSPERRRNVLPEPIRNRTPLGRVPRRDNSFLSNILSYTEPIPPLVPAMTAREDDVFASLTSTRALINLLSGDMGIVTQPVTWGNFSSPVIVRPSSQEIVEATEIVNGNTLPEGTICAVCQDNIILTDTATRILYCNHVYHHSCIEPWFMRSVFCPTCRHDIRERGTNHAHAQPQTEGQSQEDSLMDITE